MKREDQPVHSASDFISRVSGTGRGSIWVDVETMRCAALQLALHEGLMFMILEKVMEAKIG